MTPKDYTTAKAHNTTRTPDFEFQHWRVRNKVCIGGLLVPQKAVQSSTLPTAHFHSVQNGWNSSVTAAGTHSFWPLWHPSPVGVAISAKCADASKIFEVSHSILAVQKHAISMTQGPKPPLETAEQRRRRVCIGCTNAHDSHVNMVRDCLWRL